MTLQARKVESQPGARPGHLRKPHYETLAAFRYALRRFIHFSEEAAQAEGVTAQQYQALLAIKGFPARDIVTVGELAERLQLRHHSAVGLIDRLVMEKLVIRVPSTRDHRQVLIQITRRGGKIVEKIASVHHEQLKKIGPEIRQLLEQLGRAG
jgi:DNA-binding MarR family transcriptional regulator